MPSIIPCDRSEQAVALAVVVVDDAEIELAPLGQAETGERRVIGRVVAVPGRRDVDELQGPVQPGEDAVGHLDRVGEVPGHHHVLVVRGAVAEVVAELRRFRHRVAEPRQQARDVLLVAVGPVREIALPGQHLLADVPLDREVARRDRGADLREVGLESALVGGEEVRPRGGGDEPVADRHRRR